MRPAAIAIFSNRAATRLGKLRERTMAKGQKRSNKEVKKPKKVKEPAAAKAGFDKGVLASSLGAKKKG